VEVLPDSRSTSGGDQWHSGGECSGEVGGAADLHSWGRTKAGRGHLDPQCRFKDCQVATDVNPDGAVFRELEVTTSVSTGCVFRVANNLHAYNLDVTVRRQQGADNLAVFDYRSSHGFLLEHSRFRSADGKGVALVRSALKNGSYISNTLVLRALEVACGGCPEGGIVTFPNRKPVEFVSMTDVTDCRRSRCRG